MAAVGDAPMQDTLVDAPIQDTLEKLLAGQLSHYYPYMKPTNTNKDFKEKGKYIIYNSAIGGLYVIMYCIPTNLEIKHILVESYNDNTLRLYDATLNNIHKPHFGTFSDVLKYTLRNTPYGDELKPYIGNKFDRYKKNSSSAVSNLSRPTGQRINRTSVRTSVGTNPNVAVVVPLSSTHGLLKQRDAPVATGAATTYIAPPPSTPAGSVYRMLQPPSTPAGSVYGMLSPPSLSRNGGRRVKRHTRGHKKSRRTYRSTYHNTRRHRK